MGAEPVKNMLTNSRFLKNYPAAAKEKPPTYVYSTSNEKMDARFEQHLPTSLRVSARHRGLTDE